jgi:predicted transcriptional regulator
MGKIDEIEGKSLDFLTELYTLYKDKDFRGLDMYEIGRRANCNRTETEYIVEHLSSVDVIKREGSTDKVSLTPKGVEMMKNRTTKIDADTESARYDLPG